MTVRTARATTIVALLLTAGGLPARPVSAETSGADGAEDCWHGKLERAEWSAPDRAFDAETGRDRRHYPPDRLVDHLHMTLEMRFEDLDDRRFTATGTLRFVPLGAGASSITLDAVDLRIERVTHDGRTVEWYHDGERLTVRFEPALPAGAEQEIAIEYACERPWSGMFFTPSSPDVPHYTAEVHTQGQTESNRHWFPCHDFPNERLTTELIVDVPARCSVSGNGRLVDHAIDGDRAVWHWLQDTPHVNYLVSLVIGEFDIVEIPHERVPMQVWVPKGWADRVERSYGRTGAMIDVFERRFGVPYPWARYDQLLVKNFGSGGMENTSATSMYPTAALDERAILDGDLDGLIAHELAHQWTGDLITCRSWAHIWLNEGWATYGSALWSEARFGEDGYLDSMRRNFRRVTARDRTSNDLPMVSPVYEHPGETFRRRANPYPKGASILHMLRMMLGEDVFWTGVRLYMNRHALGTVETNDFRYAMEEASGLGLEWFFDQWCFRPGVPELETRLRYEPVSGDLVVDIEQTQQIDARTPAFRFTLPVHVRVAGETHVHAIEVTERSTSWRTTLDGVPELVVVDPHLHVLKKNDVDKPRHLWVAQALRGPTIVARGSAIAALGDVDGPESITLLAAIARDDREPHQLRSRAVDTLAGLGSPEARAELLAIATDGVAEAKVRVNVVRALRDLDAEDVTDLLAAAATGDESYAVRVSAIRGLASLEADEHADAIAELVRFDSQHDQVRSAALAALADLDDARGLDLAIEYSAFGWCDRSRPRAIDAIAELAHHDRDRAVEVLLAYLEDPERRAVRAAGAALAEIGDERGLPPLEAMADSHPSPRLRDSAEGWVKKIREAKKKDIQK
jgi:aminopeptidase N